MTPFTTLSGIAAPLSMINIDTDRIIPKQFLTTIKRTGLSKGLFYDLRFDAEGRERTDFVLNNPAYKNTKILVAGQNFGCGSSREHAPWALMDYGIFCVIAESFADIFYNNCLQNGLLPAIVSAPDAATVLTFLEKNPGAELTVDLEKKTIAGATKDPLPFTIDPARKRKLLLGLDAIGETLQHEAAIATWEEKNRAEKPWLWTTEK